MIEIKEYDFEENYQNELIQLMKRLYHKESNADMYIGYIKKIINKANPSFDFIKIKKTEFTSDPNEFFSLEGLNFSFVHQKKHTKAFDELHKQFGEDSEGLARMIRRMPGGLAALSREAVYAEDAEPV